MFIRGVSLPGWSENYLLGNPSPSHLNMKLTSCWVKWHHLHLTSHQFTHTHTRPPSPHTHTELHVSLICNQNCFYDISHQIKSITKVLVGGVRGNHQYKSDTHTLGHAYAYLPCTDLKKSKSKYVQCIILWRESLIEGEISINASHWKILMHHFTGNKTNKSILSVVKISNWLKQYYFKF